MERPKKGFFYSVGKNLHVGPWKRMWMEIPHVPFFGLQAIAGVALAVYWVNYIYEDGIGLQYKYTVMRPDDPRVKQIKQKFMDLP